MHDGSMLYYFIFWSIISSIVAVLATISLVYLFYLLREIKQSLSRIETLCQPRALKKRRSANNTQPNRKDPIDIQ